MTAAGAMLLMNHCLNKDTVSLSAWNNTKYITVRIHVGYLPTLLFDYILQSVLSVKNYVSKLSVHVILLQILHNLVFSLKHHFLELGDCVIISKKN